MSKPLCMLNRFASEFAKHRIATIKKNVNVDNSLCERLKFRIDLTLLVPPILRRRLLKETFVGCNDDDRLSLLHVEKICGVGRMLDI